MANRRHILAGLAALPLSRHGPALASDQPGLAELAAAKNLFFGAATTSEQLTAGDEYARLLRAECGVWTPEWELKWGEIELTQGNYAYERVDALVAAAAVENKRLRGHALLWHEQWPGWGADLGAPADWSRVVEPWLVNTVSRYPNAFFQWDLINEPLEPEDGLDGDLRNTPFYRMLGADYIPEAFQLAHAHAPAAKLYLNEYGLCYDERWQANRRNAMLRLIERLLARDVPLHGLGIQAHLDISRPFNETVFARFLDEVASFGLDITLTELDVREGDNNPHSLPERQLRAATEVRNIVGVALEQPAVKGVVSWSLSDRYSWLRYIRKVLDNQGLPYDEHDAPTPMRAALAELFQQAAVRDA